MRSVGCHGGNGPCRADSQRTLLLPVVHAVLAGERLDEVLQRHVPPHIVALPDGALDLSSDMQREVVSHRTLHAITSASELVSSHPDRMAATASALRSVCNAEYDDVGWPSCRMKCAG